MNLLQRLRARWYRPSPAEVTFAFGSWLATRREAIVMGGGTTDLAAVAKVIQDYNDHFGFPAPREDWHLQWKQKLGTSEDV